MLTDLLSTLSSEPFVALFFMAGFLLGLVGGLGVAVAITTLDRPTLPEQHKHPQHRKLPHPRKQCQTSSDRATLQAVMMVETGAFSAPKRS